MNKYDYCPNCGEKLELIYQNPNSNFWNYGGWYAHCHNCDICTEEAAGDKELAISQLWYDYS